MSDYHYLARGQAVVLDLPAPIRRDMPVRHFTLDRIEDPAPDEFAVAG